MGSFRPPPSPRPRVPVALVRARGDVLLQARFPPHGPKLHHPCCLLHYGVWGVPPHRATLWPLAEDFRHQAEVQRRWSIGKRWTFSWFVYSAWIMYSGSSVTTYLQWSRGILKSPWLYWFGDVSLSFVMSTLCRACRASSRTLWRNLYHIFVPVVTLFAILSSFQVASHSSNHIILTLEYIRSISCSDANYEDLCCTCLAFDSAYL